MTMTAHDSGLMAIPVSTNSVSSASTTWDSMSSATSNGSNSSLTSAMASNIWNSTYFTAQSGFTTANPYVPTAADFGNWPSWNTADPRFPIPRFAGQALYPNPLGIGPQAIRNSGRRRRNLFSPQQVQVLKEAFDKESYVKPEHREMLAKRTGLTPQQVKIWFQNNRYKCKQKNKEDERSGNRGDVERKFISDSPSSSGNDMSMRSNNSPEDVDLPIKMEDSIQHNVENHDIKDVQQFASFNPYSYGMGAMQTGFHPFYQSYYPPPGYPAGFPTAP